MTPALRHYQVQAFAEVQAGWADARRQLVVMATGTGKTCLFAKVAEAERQHGRVLILAHREELLAQARDRFAEWTGLWTSIEQAEQRASALADVVIASVQTLSRPARLQAFDPRAFGLVIIDEAHHAPAESYQRIVKHFADAKILGVTATPDRLDKVSLKGTFDKVAFIYEIRDAIDDGWLVPIRQKVAFIKGLDLSSVRTLAGDLSETDLETAMIRHEVPHAVARATVEASGSRPTLVFGVTIPHTKILAEAFKHYTDPSKILALSGDDSKDTRREGLERFRGGEIQYLINCMLFTEGFDAPWVACVSMARPTKSRALYAQMIGRGTRTLDGLNIAAPRPEPSWKQDLLVIDYAGNAGRHTLINTFDILGGTDTEIRTRAEARAQSEADGVDVIEELKRQQEELAEFYRREALRIAQQGKATQIGWQDVDPFRTVFSILKVRPLAGRMGGVEPTAGQLDMLRHHKIDKDLSLSRLDRGQAAELIAKIQERPRKGFCTYKQARVLTKFGYDPDVPFDQASALIDRLAANGWRRPSDPAPTT